ncbi:MAG: ADP-ribosylglycohydrolase family protein [Dehalococcoidia bacterium]
MTTAAAPNRRRIEFFTGCLLGGAVGDALGAPIEFLSLPDIRSQFGSAGLQDFSPAYGRRGAVTDDTQMTLFTAEGLLRADNRLRDTGSMDSVTLVYRAYLRWLETQEHLAPSLGGGLDKSWLSQAPALRSRRAPGNTCLSALRSGSIGAADQPLNDSKGCGGVMRAAPAGLAEARPFRLGCDVAAITHGHPGGYLPAGCFAQVIALIINGADLLPAVTAAIEELVTWKESRETAALLTRAVAMAQLGRPTPEAIESLGSGWTGDEALAIAVLCALTADDFEDGVLMAVNHGGDSDSTGSIAGNILGALLGARAIPLHWLGELELRETIEEVAEDLFRHFGGLPAFAETGPGDSDRYPGY